MAITLTYNATTLTLPDALSWADEYTWSPIEQSQTYTTTGALLIEEHVKQAGKPFTLEGTVDRTWCTRALVDTLHAWAATPGIVMTLVLRGLAHSVTFDHTKGAIQGLPVLFYADGSIEAVDFYVPTIRMIEV